MTQGLGFRVMLVVGLAAKGLYGSFPEYGTPIYTPKSSCPYYRDPPKCTPNFGKPPYRKVCRVQGSV